MHGPLNIKVKIPVLCKYSIVDRSRHNSIFVSYIAYVYYHQLEAAYMCAVVKSVDGMLKYGHNLMFKTSTKFK